MPKSNFNLISFENPIPSIVEGKPERNAFISPSGKIYTFDGARHSVAAAFIAIWIEGETEDMRKNGESWEDYLKRKYKYACIKDASWMGIRHGCITKLFTCYQLTKKQMNSLWDYCNHFEIDYEETFGEHLNADEL